MSGLHWLWWPFKAIQCNKPTTTQFWVFLLVNGSAPFTVYFRGLLGYSAFQQGIQSSVFYFRHTCHPWTFLSKQNCQCKPRGPQPSTENLLGISFKYYYCKDVREGRALAARIPSQLRILASLRQPPTSLNASCLVIFIHNLNDQFLIHNPAHSLNQYGPRSSHPSGRVAALQKLTTN